CCHLLLASPSLPAWLWCLVPSSTLFRSAILSAASLCGIRDVFRVGGSQAIGAMAYGTSTVPKVDKIFGYGAGSISHSTNRLTPRSEEHTSELQPREHRVCRPLPEKTKTR